jgi:hypothetical protein
MQKITHVSSMFVKATRLGTIEIQDLRESLKYASGRARNLGVELPVLLGFLVQMSESGLKASLAGTSLNTALTNLIRNSKALRTNLPNFQVLTDTAGNLDMVATLNALFAATARMSKIQRASTLGDIFNLRGERAVSAVQEMERVESFIKQIATAGQEARLAATKMESGLGGAMRRASSAAEALNIAMGYTFSNSGKAILNFTTVAIDALERVVQKYKGMIALLILSPGILAGVAVGSLTLSFALNRLYTVVGMLASGFRSLKSVAGVMAGPLLAGVSQLTNRRSLLRSAGRVSAGTRAAFGAARSGASAVTGIASTTRQGVSNTVQLVQEKQFYAKRAALYTAYQSNLRRRAQYYNTLAHNMQRRGFAAQAAQAARASARAKSGAATAGWIAANAKRLQGGSIVSGLAKLAGGGILRSLVASGPGLLALGRNLLGLARGFTIVAGAVTRFAFSWNMVGLILNGLLLFGDKIDFVRNVFINFGKGFSDAFKQVARIAEYAAPALKLFQLGFTAFVSGDSNVGIQAVVSAFQGLVGIIGNQLTAAWNAFAARVDYIWQTIVAIGTALGNVASALISGIGQSLKVLFGPLMEGLGGGTLDLGSGLMSAFQFATVVFDNFITEFFKVIIMLETKIQNLLESIPYVIGNSLQNLPGVSGIGKNMMTNAAQNMTINANRGKSAQLDLEIEKRERAKSYQKIFAESGKKLEAQRKNAVQQSNSNSFGIMQDLQKEFVNLGQQFQTNNQLRAQELARQQQSVAAKSSIPAGPKGIPPEIQEFRFGLSSLIGDINSVRNNIYKVETPNLVNEQKKTNDILERMDDRMARQGAF